MGESHHSWWLWWWSRAGRDGCVLRTQVLKAARVFEFAICHRQHLAGWASNHTAGVPWTEKRQHIAGTSFAYDPDYLEAGLPGVATTLPARDVVIETPGGGLPAFFTGLLPEGHRLTVLKDAAKTSLSDELTLLLAVGADAPGDVQIVPAGETPAEPDPLADITDPSHLDFGALAVAVDLHALPGVQPKASASRLSAPLAARGGRYVLKLDPPNHPHLVHNEAMHLAAAKALKIPVSTASVVQDRNGLPGLLVTRFDRTSDGDEWRHLAMEDGAQVLGLPPSSKYNVTSEEVVAALAGASKAPVVAVRNLYLQFVFAWLTGNGDLHAKNVAILGDRRGGFVVAPVYDIPCTLLYGDDTMALPVAGRAKNLRARHWQEFADSIGLPQRAAASANALALRAEAGIDLEALPFTGSPLNHTVRELRHRRQELSG
ncbi:type II toxin-antitoxin system HipA family toxin [Pseudarthrobacter sp. O4]|uniref:type II toxin-antitoxin system HipA family toxin n=1 Tax=Pseudarthrobacter sp. O4 TaxID=3418417 RepID=UPI003CEE3FBD